MKLRVNPEHDGYVCFAQNLPKLRVSLFSAAVRSLQVTSLTGGTGRQWWHGDSGSSCQNRSWHIAKCRMLKWSLLSVFAVQRCSGTLHGASTNLVWYGVTFSLDVLCNCGANCTPSASSSYCGLFVRAGGHFNYNRLDIPTNVCFRPYYLFISESEGTKGLGSSPILALIGHRSPLKVFNSTLVELLHHSLHSNPSFWAPALCFFHYYCHISPFQVLCSIFNHIFKLEFGPKWSPLSGPNYQPSVMFHSTIKRQPVSPWQQNQ